MKKQQIGVVGVDSGQVMICDPCCHYNKEGRVAKVEIIFDEEV